MRWKNWGRILQELSEFTSSDRGSIIDCITTLLGNIPEDDPAFSRKALRIELGTPYMLLVRAGDMVPVNGIYAACDFVPVDTPVVITEVEIKI